MNGQRAGSQVLGDLYTVPATVAADGTMRRGACRRLRFVKEQRDRALTPKALAQAAFTDVLQHIVLFYAPPYFSLTLTTK
jgi:hypothetical protein